MCYNSIGSREEARCIQEGDPMNNILFFLTPKAMCSFLYDDFTIRQALEKTNPSS